MPRKTRWRTRLVILTGLMAGHAVADSICYDTWGNADSNQLPCSASDSADGSATTWCCNKGDYCLSNGLCLSPGSNNLMTQQGCTDKAWGSPCKKFCPPSGDANRALNEIPLIPCPSSLDTSTNDIKFCCGPDAASCCQNASAWTTIPTGSILGLPASETSSSSTTSSSSLRIGLGIGLGIGIPILLVLLAVAYLLAQPHLRRRRRRRARARAGTAGTASSEKTGSDAAAPRSRHRRDSFGRVNTNGPPSDDGDDWSPHHPHHHHAWPPTLAAWAARSWGAAAAAGDERPQSPREMEARSGSRLRGRLFGLGSGPAAAAAAAELPTEGGSSRVVVEDGAGGRGKVRVAAEEVELPTPDTPRPPAAAAAAAAVAVAGGSEGKRTVGGDMEAGRGGYRPSRGGGGQEAGREGEA